MTMTHKLHENFLDDPEVYQACERFWEKLVSSLVGSMGQLGKWRRWIPRTYTDGKLIDLDGNPIFDGRSEERDRAFRIIQHRAEESARVVEDLLRKWMTPETTPDDMRAFIAERILPKSQPGT
jgi:hypothetical protein